MSLNIVFIIIVYSLNMHFCCSEIDFKNIFMNITHSARKTSNILYSIYLGMTMVCFNKC